MPLFVCSECHIVDNTALSKYWWWRHYNDLPPLCTQCAGGEWHNHFDRVEWKDWPNPAGVQYPPSSTPPPPGTTA